MHTSSVPLHQRTPIERHIIIVEMVSVLEGKPHLLLCGINFMKVHVQ